MARWDTARQVHGGEDDHRRPRRSRRTGGQCRPSVWRLLTEAAKRVPGRADCDSRPGRRRSTRPRVIPRMTGTDGAKGNARAPAEGEAAGSPRDRRALAHAPSANHPARHRSARHSDSQPRWHPPDTGDMRRAQLAEGYPATSSAPCPSIPSSIPLAYPDTPPQSRRCDDQLSPGPGLRPLCSAARSGVSNRQGALRPEPPSLAMPGQWAGPSSFLRSGPLLRTCAASGAGQ